MHQRFLKFAIAPAILALAACSQASDPQPQNTTDWAVNEATSRVSYVTIKAGDIAENNSFGTIRGTVAKDGKAHIQIAMDSIETLIDIRNERVREFLFDTANFPTASVKAHIDSEELQALETGEQKTQNLEILISVKGIEKSFATQAVITRLGEDKVLVQSHSPIIVHAQDFGLEGGVAKLQELAGLPAITPVVPVTFALIFER